MSSAYHIHGCLLGNLFTNIKIRWNFFKNGNYRSFCIYFGDNFVVIQYGDIFTALLEYISVRCVEPMADNLYPENTYKCSLEKFTKPCIWLFWNVTFFVVRIFCLFKKVILLMNVVEIQSSTC